ncbi:bifunctional RNase H/acid phosphatase [Staphylococcus chromogenes]|nr:bifunctional RNase H/acid phosphatase [Staphylococcus chromogenes]
MKLVIYADGGSRGNPGVAGSGTVVYDAQRRVLKEIAYVVGKATNNVAEYRGLVEGLKAAQELGATEVEVFMDSKLVVEQMSGRWKIKHPDMKVLALEAQQRARELEKVSYTWVPREKNKAADALSNVAMDACADGHPVGPVATEPASPQEVTDVDKPAQAGANKSSWHGATVKPTRFILLRHGETAMSVAKQYSGLSDPELTDNGQAQAAAAATRLAQYGAIDVILASPLQRAQQTAKAVADRLGLEVETVDTLRELDFGRWEGKTFAEVQEEDAEVHRDWLADTKVEAPGGESVQQVARRVKKFVDDTCSRYEGKNVLVVSHVTPIKCVLKQALGASPSVVHRIHLNLASVSIVEFYADGPTLVRLMNDTAHL